MNEAMRKDAARYAGEGVPHFLRYFRKCQDSKTPFKFLYRLLFRWSKRRNHIEIGDGSAIGGGLYVGHPYCITINPKAIIGENCNIHKGVTIGQENRGERKGTPTIGNRVWIGVNATLVGKITVGDDVLIAPNTYVNCDIPSHSVVFGNPCIVKHKDDATGAYINNTI